MQEYGISPPTGILVVAIGVVVLAVAALFLKRASTRGKLVSLALSIVVAFFLIFTSYRPVTIRVSEDGVVVDGRGGVALTWPEITSAVFETNLRASRFRPSVRTRGVAIGEYRSGRFLMSNGDPAQVYMEQTDAAVVLRTSDLTYLLAPDDVAELAEAINTYRVYE